MLVLDEHPSHLTFKAFKLAISLNIEPFHLLSHSLHITQPLDVAAFGPFKGEVTSTFYTFPRRVGGKTPIKMSMANVIQDAFARSFTPSQVKAYIAREQVCGLWASTGL